MKIYELEIWNGDFSTHRIFSTLEAAKAAYDELLSSGEYFSDISLCEFVLKGSEFVQNGFSLI